MIHKREIEKKFTVEGVFGNFRDIAYVIRQNLVVEHATSSVVSTDYFWAAPGVDFARLRDGSNEFTLKKTDRGTVTDRIEENVSLSPASFESMKRALTLLYGPSNLCLTKVYELFYVNVPVPTSVIDVRMGTVVSIYSILGDPQHRIFLEVEAGNMEVVDLVADDLMKALVLKQETRSLYEIFLTNHVGTK